MRTVLLVSIFLLMALGCAYVRPDLKKDGEETTGFELNLDFLQATNEKTKLRIQLELDSGNYFISPLSTDSMFGKLQLQLLGNEVQLDGEWDEHPRSNGSWDPHAEAMVRFVNQSTAFHVPLATPQASRWRSAGKLFFVLEPMCIPYAVDFEMEESGNGPEVSNVQVQRLH